MDGRKLALFIMLVSATAAALPQTDDVESLHRNGMQGTSAETVVYYTNRSRR